MRALMDRLAATMLVALLAGPGLASWRPGLVDEREPSRAPDTGMNAPPGPTASAALSIAPAALAVPLSATGRVVVAFDPLACERPAVRVLRPTVAVRSAPAILRI